MASSGGLTTTEVCRRYSSSIPETSYASTSTQTEPVSGDEQDDDSPGNCQPSDCRQLADRMALFDVIEEMDMEQLELITDGFIDETDSEIQQDLYDVEYEEVTLHRGANCEKLGLTLCYGKGDDVDTDIFVSQIEPDSIAFRDGRIRIGDQILQINCVDVHTRNQAIDQFRRDRPDITLLLARSVQAGDFTQEMNNGMVHGRPCSVVHEQTAEDEDGHLSDGTKDSAGSAHEKDSGISRATDSDPELPPPISSPSKSSCGSGGDNDVSTPDCWRLTASALLAESDQSTTPTQSTSKNCPTISGAGMDDRQSSYSDATLERELYYLHKEMEHIQLECDRLIEQHARSEQRVRVQMEQASRLAANLDHLTQTGSPTTTNDKCRPSKLNVGGAENAKPYKSRSPIEPLIGLDCQRQLQQLPYQQHHLLQQQQQQPPPQQQQQFQLQHQLQMHQQQSSSRHNRQQTSKTRDDTSSAYNTGNESCRSTPLKTLVEQTVVVPSRTNTTCSTSSGSNNQASVGDDGKRDSALFTLPLRREKSKGKEPKGSGSASRVDKANNNNGTGNLANGGTSNAAGDANGHGLHQQPQGSGRRPEAVVVQQTSAQTPVPFYFGDTLYTNSENLQQTILLQQRLLRQAMIQQARQLKTEATDGQWSPENANGLLLVPTQSVDCLANRRRLSGGVSQTETMKMQWKIKRRSDGSRYITRRPVRNKLLQERAMQLSNERTGVSTDDDALSELKIGKYWSREERKKHLERAKERKKRQEELLRRKAEAAHNDPAILQLSNKKMLRRQGQQLFDKFTTLQEFLSHGSRTVESRPLGILSVTTV